MSSIYLETERMRLRELEPGEASILFDLDSDPEVMRFLRGGQATELDVCIQIIHKIRGYYEKHDHRFGLWFAEEKISQKIMGWFFLRPDKGRPDDISNPELGYRLKKEFWGKGFATEGSQALIGKSFSELNCNSVFAVAMTGNLASQNVMKKIGMKFEGDYKQDECFAPGGDTSAVHYVLSLIHI